MARWPSGTNSLGTLRLADLKAVAEACGLASSGTKAALASRLESAAREASSPSSQRQRQGATATRPREQRILSIDLGIRNLAFCLLTPSGGRSARAAGRGSGSPPAANVQVWRRVALAGPTGDAMDSPSATSSSHPRSTLEEEEEGEEEEGQEAEEATGDGAQAEETDAWSPARMADLTLALVRDQFLPGAVIAPGASSGGGSEKLPLPPPTHVLIERQRFRSGGRAAVQEWTLRVNTLEAMLYATLRTLREVGRWDGEVYAVAPRRVGSFWLAGEEGAEDAGATAPGKKTKKVKTEKVSKASAKARNKQDKIDLVARWLLEEKIKLVGEPGVTAQSYLDRWQGKRKKGRSGQAIEPVGEKFKKLDDLADCLLQGVAWIRWEENRKILAREGPLPLLCKDE